MRRRLLRHAFTICSAISLMLCVAVGVAWAGPCRKAPSSLARQPIWIYCRGGEFVFKTVKFVPIEEGGPGVRFPVDIRVPLWLVAGVLAALPTWYATGLIRSRHRKRQGDCPTCGYDLRAHATGERCPECGTVVSCPPTPDP
jgi:hypothetical protein